MGLALVMALKFYTSVAKWLKLNVTTYFGLISVLSEVSGEKLVLGTFLPPPLPRPYCAFHFVEMQSAFCLHLQNLLEFFN